MSQALVNPYILRWARERSYLGVDMLAHKIGTKVEKVLAWEMGEALPTFKQAQKLAYSVHIPFGYLFLPVPPVETIPIPDLRTIGDFALGKTSPEFRDLIGDVMRKRDWFVEYLRKQEADPVPFVGKFNMSTPYEEVAADISKTLGIDGQLRQRSRNWEDFLRTMLVQAEKCGIWIMRSGIVGSNTHRPLLVEEFRGFAISEKLAPLIFINGKDAKAAQIFTCAHELAHLWLGESGISNVSLGADGSHVSNRIERFCNHVAVELLVPKNLFLVHWNLNQDIGENADRLARQFRVSTVVIARRALDLNLIDWADYWNFYESQRDKWTRTREDSEGGGDYYRTLKTRNGTRFSQAVLSSTYEGKLLFREAAALLGTSVGNLDQYAKNMGVR
ncbi:MAG: ImmA/IrrE family metallo-endopeptidase [Proteobacteria bacterium]|nr:ImmA/IrrE family metallo-endopeptidase [Pseudomonadota bacterium]